MIDRQVLPDRNVINGPDGEERVEPKAMLVLCYLASRGGEVVTRQELLAHIWKDTYSGDEALSRCVSLLRSALGERRPGFKFIETVPKTGYRLVAPVEASPQQAPASASHRGNNSDRSAGPGAPPAQSQTSVRTMPFVAAGAALIALLGILVWLVPSGEAPGNSVQSRGAAVGEQGRPPGMTATAAPNSIAVLPMTNKSPDPDNAYFAAGIHEAILNQLVKIDDLQVTSRVSVLRYAESDKGLSQIADELNVGTVLTGSVRFADNRVKITAELIRADDEVYLWSEAYEFELDDIFAIETDVALKVARAMEASLLPDELDSIQRPPSQSAEAYTLYLQYRYQLERESARSTLAVDGWIETGVRKLEKAIAIDPLFARGYAELGFVNWMKGSISPGPELEVLYDRAVTFANKAVALDDTLSTAYETLARVAFDRSQWEAWEVNARKSVETNDLDGRAAFNFAMTLANVGQYGEAYKWYDVALTKSPSIDYYWEGAIAARIWGADYENALSMTGQYRAVGGDSNAYHAFRAYALDRLGRKAESDQEFDKISAEPMRVAMWVIPGFHDYLLCQSDQRDAVMLELAAIEISVARELRTQYCAAGAGEIDSIFESFDRTIEDEQIIYLTDVISREVRADSRWQNVEQYMNLP